MAKRKSGSRHKNGRLKAPTTIAERRAKVEESRPNPRIIARIAYFTHPKLHKGKAGIEAHDPIGMLWATLWLENHGHDSKEMVRIAREYGDLFYERFGGVDGDLNLEPPCIPQGSGRPPEQCQSEGRSERYCKLDEALSYGPERKAVRDIILGYYGSDEVPAWVQRLVNERRRLLGLPVAGWLPFQEDHDRLACLIRGLVRLVDGALPARFERNRITA